MTKLPALSVFLAAALVSTAYASNAAAPLRPAPPPDIARYCAAKATYERSGQEGAEECTSREVGTRRLKQLKITFDTESYCSTIADREVIAHASDSSETRSFREAYEYNHCQGGAKASEHIAQSNAAEYPDAILLRCATEKDQETGLATWASFERCLVKAVDQAYPLKGETAPDKDLANSFKAQSRNPF